MQNEFMRRVSDGRLVRVLHRAENDKLIVHTGLDYLVVDPDEVHIPSELEPATQGYPLISQFKWDDSMLHQELILRNGCSAWVHQMEPSDPFELVGAAEAYIARDNNEKGLDTESWRTDGTLMVDGNLSGYDILALKSDVEVAQFTRWHSELKGQILVLRNGRHALVTEVHLDEDPALSGFVLDCSDFLVAQNIVRWDLKGRKADGLCDESFDIVGVLVGKVKAK
jgi:hypothetical protein